jgi:triacylglycerol lipase
MQHQCQVVGEFSRRIVRVAGVAAALLLVVLAACSSVSVSDDAKPKTMSERAFAPIVFVHGNGDTAALWHTTMWRFESNGWPHERLFALDAPYPLARDDDTVSQAGRTSTEEHAQFISDEVARIRKQTGASKVILIGNSRGGFGIRNFVQNKGGDAVVSHAILGGVPNHGVWANDTRLGSEFNGKGRFLVALNAPKNVNGDEVTGPVKWLTLRSDNNDKFAQPDGAWINQRDTPTGVTYDGPALKGATNIVLPARDHRETSYHPDAFAATWKFITGDAPRTTSIEREDKVVLDGQISALGINGVGDFVTNVPLAAGATVEVFAVDATGARIGSAAYQKTIASDGKWGPFAASNQQAYEFVITASGYATTHIYRSPFPRSSSVIHMRPARIAATDKDAVAVVTMTRPRGYFGFGRDSMSLDGKPLQGIVAGVAGLSVAKVKLMDDVGRSVVGEFNGERIAARAWPIAENHVTLIELH